MPDTRPVPIVAFLVVVSLTALGLLASLPFFAYSLLFFGIFDFGSMWHLFLFAYTIGIPPAAVVGYLVFMLERTRLTAVAASLLSIAAFATGFLWTNPYSTGLID